MDDGSEFVQKAPTGLIARLATRGWVTLPEFARIIGVSLNTIYTMRDEGKFAFIVVGRTGRVYVDEVERFLKEGNLPTDDSEPKSTSGEGS